MSSSEHNDPDNTLGERLEELESLLDKDETSTKATKIKVPVLDELVTEADFINHENDNDLEKVEEQIADLAEKLGQKIFDELDQLVLLLKNNLKSSIIEELRKQANLDQDELKSEDNTDGSTNQDL